jgi:hypothetical protein
MATSVPCGAECCVTAPTTYIFTNNDISIFTLVLNHSVIFET